MSGVRAMKTYRIGKLRCPYCDCPVDCATPIMGRHAPVPDSIVVCLSCGDIAKFSAGMTLVPMSQEEFDVVPAEIRAGLKQAQIEHRQITAHVRAAMRLGK